jgi:GLPGLI family protein
MFKYLIIFIFTIKLTFSQNYKLVYEVTDFKNLNESDFISNDSYNNFLKEFKLAKGYLQDLKIVVFVTDEGHYYKIEKNLENDFSPNSFLSSLFLGYAGLYDSFFYNNQISYYFNTDDPFITKIDSNDYKWKIKKNKIVKYGYNCLEANLIKLTDIIDYQSDELRVFFTNDLGFTAGPTIFANVPGVVVELENKYLSLKLADLLKYYNETADFKKFIEDKRVLSHKQAQEFYKKATEHLRN